MRETLPFQENVLQTLHNICATAADWAKRGDEVARILQKDPAEIERILDDFKNQGFAESFYDNEGKNLLEWITMFLLIKRLVDGSS